MISVHIVTTYKSPQHCWFFFKHHRIEDVHWKPPYTFKSIRCRSSRPGYVQRPKYVSTPLSVPCIEYQPFQIPLRKLNYQGVGFYIR